MLVPTVRTWTGAPAAWISTRFAALVRAWSVVLPLELALKVAHCVLAIWIIETRWGQHEDNFNAGNIRRGSWRGNWFVRSSLEWRSYASLDEAAADAVEFLSSQRYKPAIRDWMRGDLMGGYGKLVDHPTLGPGYHPASESSLDEFLNAWSRATTI